MLPMGFGRGRGFGGLGRFLPDLLLVLIAEKPSYGYELAERLREAGIKIYGLGQMGAIYRYLAFLEQSGFVMTSWDTATAGPARKIYRITPLGEEYLHEVAARFQEFRELLDTFLEKYKHYMDSRDSRGS